MDGLRRYTDLSERCFFADDKKFVCEYIETSNISIRRFAKDHKLNYARIANWMLKWRCLKDTGKDTFYEDGSGRPPKLDSASSIALCSYLRDCRQAQNAPTMAQVRTKIASEVKATAQRRGIATEDGRIDRKTELNILKAHNCEEGKCQFKTRARIINEADPRNVYTMACMMWAFCSLLVSCMCYNWDATQFYVSPDVSNTVVYIKSANGHEDVPLTRESSGGLGISIKYYHFHNSAGETAPAVYVVADDSMADGDFFVLPVVGLGNSTEVGSLGYLCFCKTRNCNDKYYRYFAKTIVIPFVKKVRDVHQPLNEDGSPMRAFVMCDGEESQIRVFQEEEIRELFRENMIDFGKTPASCSAILQSSDVSMFFKATKQVLKSIQDQQYRSDILDRNLRTAFIHYRTQRNSGLSPAMESKIVDALQQICYTIHKTLNPDIIKKGYSDCGQDAPISLDLNGVETYAKYEACIQKCKRKLTVAECQIMRDNLPHFVGIMRQHGKITEAEMNERQIPNYNNFDSDRKPKDQRTLHKQRAVVMNADDVVSQFIDYQRHREAHRAALEARRIHREITAADRQAAKAAREVEKRRRSLLTDEEKRQESNAKRQATIARNREERARQQLLRIGNGNSNDGNSQISDSHDGTRNQLTEIFEGNSDDSNDGYLSLEDEVPL